MWSDLIENLTSEQAITCVLFQAPLLTWELLSTYICKAVPLYYTMSNMIQCSAVYVQIATHLTDCFTIHICLNLPVVSPLDNLQFSYKTQMQSYHSLYVQLLTQ